MKHIYVDSLLDERPEAYIAVCSDKTGEILYHIRDGVPDNYRAAKEEKKREADKAQIKLF